MHDQVQALVDRIHEDTMFQSSPMVIVNHPAMAELIALPKAEVTGILLGMVWHDPSWVHTLALRQLHGDDGARWPESDNGRFLAICRHWIRWGIREGYLGDVEPTTEETYDPRR